MKRSSKKLSEMLEKWRKRKKGYFAVCTKEGKRFVVPLCYLNHPIFQVLLEMAEEEFGSNIPGPLRVPYEDELLDYILSIFQMAEEEFGSNIPGPLRVPCEDELLDYILSILGNNNPAILRKQRTLC